MKNNNLRKYILISIMVALACVLSIVDGLISKLVLSVTPILAMAPGFKIGLANIIILFLLYKYDFYWAGIAALLKSVIAGLIFGGLTSFLIGLTGTVLSFLGMWALKKFLRKDIFVVFISAIGGVLHVVGQISIVALLYKNADVFLYLPFLLLTGLVAGIFVGYITFLIIKIFRGKRGNSYEK